MYRILLLLTVFFLSSFYQFPSARNQVTKAAEQGLPKFLALIPAGKEGLYGFSAGDDLKSCTLGKPYQMLTLNADFYKGVYDPKHDYLVPGKVWRVPVVANGAYRALLTVAGESDNFNAVDMGGAGLATELQQEVASLGNDALTGDYYILRVYPLSADFFVIAPSSSFTTASFFPLSSALSAIPALKNKAYPLEEVLPVIKATLDQSKN